MIMKGLHCFSNDWVAFFSPCFEHCAAFVKHGNLKQSTLLMKMPYPSVYNTYWNPFAAKYDYLCLYKCKAATIFVRRAKHAKKCASKVGFPRGTHSQVEPALQAFVAAQVFEKYSKNSRSFRISLFIVELNRRFLDNENFRIFAWAKMKASNLSKFSSSLKQGCRQAYKAFESLWGGPRPIRFKQTAFPICSK